MRWISSDPLNRFRFPIDDWRFVEVEPSLDDLGVTETLFSIGNGYLGMRGNPEEGRKSYSHGTFINGFHETWTIKHAEEAFGFASTGQTIVNVPDAKLIKIYVDDEPLTLGQSDLDHYERALDFRAGCLTRDLVWRTPAGKRVKLSSRRMVSFTDRHLALFEIELRAMRRSCSAPRWSTDRMVSTTTASRRTRRVSTHGARANSTVECCNRAVSGTTTSEWRSDTRPPIPT